MKTRPVLLGQPWEEIIPPKELRKILRMDREYERLAKQIDRKYVTGRVEGVEELEQRAAEIEEALFALYELYTEADEGTHPELWERETSLEEDLAQIYLNQDRYFERDDWISAMQDAIRTALLWEGQDVHPTPEQAIEAAKDAVARKTEIRRRYGRRQLGRGRGGR